MKKALVKKEAMRAGLDLGVQAFKEKLGHSNACTAVLANALRGGTEKSGVDIYFLRRQEAQAHEEVLPADAIFGRADILLPPLIASLTIEDIKLTSAQTCVKAALANPEDLTEHILTCDGMSEDAVQNARQLAKSIMTGFVSFFVSVFAKNAIEKAEKAKTEQVIGHGFAVIPAANIEARYRRQLLDTGQTHLIVDELLPAMRGRVPDNICRADLLSVADSPEEVVQYVAYNYPNSKIYVRPVFRHPDGEE